MVFRGHGSLRFSSIMRGARRFAIGVACAVLAGLASGGVSASDCTLIFYDLGSTKPGLGGADDGAVCQALGAAVAGVPGAGDVRQTLRPEGGRVSCVVSTSPGDLSGEALDRFRFQLGSAVRGAAGSGYKSWSSNCR